jgi:hypothetical protein
MLNGGVVTSLSNSEGSSGYRGTVQSGYTGSRYTGILPITENSGVLVLIYIARPESLVSIESNIFLIFFIGG